MFNFVSNLILWMVSSIFVDKYRCFSIDQRHTGIIKRIMVDAVVVGGGVSIASFIYGRWVMLMIVHFMALQLVEIGQG